MHTVSLQKSASRRDHAHKSAQRETAWDDDDDSETIFEQQLERDEVQAIRETYQNDWVKNVAVRPTGMSM